MADIVVAHVALDASPAEAGNDNDAPSWANHEVKRPGSCSAGSNADHDADPDANPGANPKPGMTPT